MKKYLLPKNGNFYKTNLHCHSTYSDGTLTPQELKDVYSERGYSAIAFTDHNIMIPHHELTDENFVALTGIEYDFYQGWNADFIPDGKTWYTWKGCHVNFIALDPENDIQPCYHSKKYPMIKNGEKYRHLVKYDKSLPDYERDYSPEGVSDLMQIGRKNGFFVVYNHPAWNLENYNDYTNYHGMHAVELMNSGCILEGHLGGYCPHVYDDILRTGKNVSCVAGDDNHNHKPLGSILDGSFKSFTMIKAETLTYKDLTNALINGNTYVSQGPEIYELYYEDGKVYIECSAALKVFVSCGSRRTSVVADENASITHAEFKVFEEDDYFRLTVIDKDGKCANTNAYFIKDLLK
jgi:hypothetical protein